jgi:transposase
MYVCILNQAGAILVHRNMQAGPDPFLQTLAPSRENLVVGVACICTWYWLADLCAHAHIPFVLGHALSMKALPGGKAKNDKIDAQKIAVLLRGGLLPQAYVDPAEMRATRALIGHDDQLRSNVECTIGQAAQQHDAQALYLLQTVPGIGTILRLVLFYEMHDIARFPRVQDFVSSCRLVKGAKESAGKRYGSSGTKIGNASLKWACSEAAVLFLRANPAGQKTRLEKKHGQGKALPVLAQKLARAVSYLLTRTRAFDMQTLLHG